MFAIFLDQMGGVLAAVVLAMSVTVGKNYGHTTSRLYRKS